MIHAGDRQHGQAEARAGEFGSAAIERPDKLHASRTGGFSSVEVAFDGKTLTLVNKDENLYAQEVVPGTVDQLIDTLRETYHRPLPAADLLLANVNAALMPLARDVKDLGSGVIGGVECDHLAFRGEDVDWQIWIAQGDRPYPCRYTITTTNVTGGRNTRSICGTGRPAPRPPRRLLSSCLPMPGRWS